MRPYVLDDVAEIHRVLYGDPAPMRTLGGVIAIEATRRQVELSIARQDRLGYSFWAVIDRATGAMAGEAGLLPLGEAGPEIELGYAFGSAFWGRGLATEVGGALLAEAFGPLGLERVVAVTLPENLASQRVLAKLGFAPAGRRHVWGEEQLFYIRERDKRD